MELSREVYWACNDQPSVSAEMKVHNSSTMTFHHRNVLTLTVRVPQNYNETNNERTTATLSLSTTTI